jgi:hypothetical protein
LQSVTELSEAAGSFKTGQVAVKKWCEKYYTLPLVVFSPEGKKLFHGIQHGRSILVRDLVALLCVLY